jgi:hypothetical protein
MQEVKEELKLDNLRTDHVMIRSELKYLIGAKIVDLKCRVFGGKTAPFPTVRVFGVVRHLETVRFRVDLNQEPTREFGAVANTSCTTLCHALLEWQYDNGIAPKDSKSKLKANSRDHFNFINYLNDSGKNSSCRAATGLKLSTMPGIADTYILNELLEYTT